MAKQKITKAAFKAWLKERRDEKIGKACESSKCPIAHYLLDTHSWHKVWVDAGEVTYTREKKGKEFTFILPEWADKFVDSLDLTFMNRKSKVKGKHALKILKELDAA